MVLTRSEFLFDGGGVIGDLARFSIIGGGGGGGGGATFFGIFFKLLIKTVEEVVLFDEGIFGDDSRLTLIFVGDLFIVGVGSVLIGIFCVGLFVGIVIGGFFNGIGVVNFDGDGTASFFFEITFVDDWIEGFNSESVLSFDDGRGLVDDKSISKENTFKKFLYFTVTFDWIIAIRIFYWYNFC